MNRMGIDTFREMILPLRTDSIDFIDIFRPIYLYFNFFEYFMAWPGDETFKRNHHFLYTYILL